MLLKTLTSITALAAVASAKFFYVGVAESSGEFGVYSQTKQKGFGLPGRFGVDYQFIDQKGIDIHVDQNKVFPKERASSWTGFDRPPDQSLPNRLPAGTHVSCGGWAWSKVQRDAL